MSFQKREPMLSDEEQLVMFPIKRPALYQMYVDARRSFWGIEEIDLTQDCLDWEALSEEERHFLSMVLGFFAAADGLVNLNLVNRFYQEVTWTEAKSFYGFQIGMETIHSEMYSVLIDTLIRDEREKNRLFNALSEIPAIKRKNEWIRKWIDGDSCFADRLVAFAIVEGVFFSGCFAAIFWIKKQGIMPGLCASNELISRDEGLHCNFACKLYTYLENKIPEARIHEIVCEAVEIEKMFIEDCLPQDLLGINKKSLSEYIEFVADRLVQSLGCRKVYGTENPLDFMRLISDSNKTNFFDKFVSDYHASVSVDVDSYF